MKYFSLIVLLLIQLPAFSQEKAAKTRLRNPTHVLELVQGAQADKIKVDVMISSENDIEYISLLPPDGELIKVELHILKDKIKFQLTGFKNEKLVAIQYVGKGDKNKTVEGSYAALVDGILRKDMSGKFKLEKKQP
jgi:hypothetical protein